MGWTCNQYMLGSLQLTILNSTPGFPQGITYNQVMGDALKQMFINCNSDLLLYRMILFLSVCLFNRDILLYVH